MRSLSLFALVVCLASIGCARQDKNQSSRSDVATVPDKVATIPGTPYGDFIIGEPIQHENLTIFPISSRVAKNTDRFITLDEGLKAGVVEIMEAGAVDADPFGRGGQDAGNLGHEEVPRADDLFAASAASVDPFGGDPFAEPAREQRPSDDDLFDAPVDSQSEAVADDPFGGPANNVPNVVEDLFNEDVSGNVNQLFVLNRSEKPLYLMPGEVISGGKQDRTIGQELAIQPGDKPVPIDVYCVESGRWQGRSAEETADLLSSVVRRGGASAAAYGDLQTAAKEANKGKFIASVGQLNKAARLVVQSKKGQQQVWDEVAGLSAALNVNTSSGNFSAVYADEDVAVDFQPYVASCHQAVVDVRQVVGVVVAINGEVEAVDIFESTPLFKKLWPKLLKSYALDASVAAGGEGHEKSCPVESCVAFLREAEDSNVENVEMDGGLTLTRRESNRIVAFSASDEAVGFGGGGFGGGGAGGGVFGGAVHTGAFSQ